MDSGKSHPVTAASATAKQYDVLGLGCAAIDDLLYVDQYPPADSKQRIRQRQRQCGGLTATALVAAARLGASCAYAGTLGDDELSEFVLQQMQQEGIDVSHVFRQRGVRPIHSLVIIDEKRQTRTLFFDIEHAMGAQPDWPAESLIRAARVLFVDHFGVEGMIRAARIARGCGISVVADFESDEVARFSELLELVDHLIVSQQFAHKLTGQSDPKSAARQLWTDTRRVVLVTVGSRGCWCLADQWPNGPRHFPAFRVEAVDTTGCGDVFHGAYAYALARGMDIQRRIELACAAAAIKATGRGGQASIATREVVEQFIDRFKA